MPSWNLHAYHTKELLDNQELALCERLDSEAFKVGNIAPDIYVGYMVNPTTCTIAYEVTHCAVPQIIPVPDHSRFFDEFIESVLRDRKVPDALVVGAWCHLITDAYYNARTREHLKSLGLEPCRELRIKKQADFALFGREVCPAMEIASSDVVFDQALRYPQYPIEAVDVERSIEVFNTIVQSDTAGHVASNETYQLFSRAWFEDVSCGVNEVLARSMTGLLDRIDNK